MNFRAIVWFTAAVDLLKCVVYSSPLQIVTASVEGLLRNRRDREISADRTFPAARVRSSSACAPQSVFQTEASAAVFPRAQRSFLGSSGSVAGRPSACRCQVARTNAIEDQVACSWHQVARPCCHRRDWLDRGGFLPRSHYPRSSASGVFALAIACDEERRFRSNDEPPWADQDFSNARESSLSIRSLRVSTPRRYPGVGVRIGGPRCGDRGDVSANVVFAMSFQTLIAAFVRPRTHA